MSSWWNDLELLGQIFFIIASIGTIILLIQSFLLMFGFGFGDSTDMSIDADVNAEGFDVSGTDGLSLFTVRGLVAFFSIGGWAGLLLHNMDLPYYVSILCSFVAGTIALFGVAYIFKAAFKLQSDGTRNIKNAVGKSGKVYIPIPPSKSGVGKVILMLQGAEVELEAVTEDNEPIQTGSFVTVLSAVDLITVLVTKQSINKKSDINEGGLSQWVN